MAIGNLTRSDGGPHDPVTETAERMRNLALKELGDDIDVVILIDKDDQGACHAWGFEESGDAGAIECMTRNAYALAMSVALGPHKEN